MILLQRNNAKRAILLFSKSGAQGARKTKQGGYDRTTFTLVVMLSVFLVCLILNHLSLYSFIYVLHTLLINNKTLLTTSFRSKTIITIKCFFELHFNSLIQILSYSVAYATLCATLISIFLGNRTAARNFGHVKRCLHKRYSPCFLHASRKRAWFIVTDQLLRRFYHLWFFVRQISANIRAAPS